MPNLAGSRVLVFKDHNGGLHIDPEIYQYFIPKFKLVSSLHKLDTISQKVEETREAIKIFLDSQDSVAP